MIEEPKLSNSTYRDAFEKEYQQEYGFLLQDRALIVDDVRVG